MTAPRFRTGEGECSECGDYCGVDVNNISDPEYPPKYEAVSDCCGADCYDLSDSNHLITPADLRIEPEHHAEGD